ncbi:white collar 2 type of transcription factor [Tilletia horrida]|uniref:White collar 2 type of transcription factor n=1 Tax=Tilletia horrida TaxID=155126 RepID=A0AAN6JSU4_9BASI|nr:white collar 2 type of transcription factor [Tilletia horrida]KAK0554147.1 white collar 2 type of transcription factor [Tilletia horrida]KAK0568973.1 white collar 2 type of transcription factor [Tilletia horrida]
MSFIDTGPHGAGPPPPPPPPGASGSFTNRAFGQQDNSSQPQQPMDLHPFNSNMHQQMQQQQQQPDLRRHSSEMSAINPAANNVMMNGALMEAFMQQQQQHAGFQQQHLNTSAFLNPQAFFSMGQTGAQTNDPSSSTRRPPLPHRRSQSGSNLPTVSRGLDSSLSSSSFSMGASDPNMGFLSSSSSSGPAAAAAAAAAAASGSLTASVSAPNGFNAFQPGNFTPHMFAQQQQQQQQHGMQRQMPQLQHHRNMTFDGSGGMGSTDVGLLMSGNDGQHSQQMMGINMMHMAGIMAGGAGAGVQGMQGGSFGMAPNFNTLMGPPTSISNSNSMNTNANNSNNTFALPNMPSNLSHSHSNTGPDSLSMSPPRSQQPRPSLSATPSRTSKGGTNANANNNSNNNNNRRNRAVSGTLDTSPSSSQHQYSDNRQKLNSNELREAAAAAAVDGGVGTGAARLIPGISGASGPAGAGLGNSSQNDSNADTGGDASATGTASGGNLSGGTGTAGGGGSNSAIVSASATAAAAGAIVSDFTKRKGWSMRIVEELLDFVHVLDFGGRILFASPSVTSLTGWKPEELVGKEIVDFIHPNDRGAFVREFEKLVDAFLDQQQHQQQRQQQRQDEVAAAAAAASASRVDESSQMQIDSVPPAQPPPANIPAAVPEKVPRGRGRPKGKAKLQAEALAQAKAQAQTQASATDSSGSNTNHFTDSAATSTTRPTTVSGMSVNIPPAPVNQHPDMMSYYRFAKKPAHRRADPIRTKSLSRLTFAEALASRSLKMGPQTASLLRPGLNPRQSSAAAASSALSRSGSRLGGASDLGSGMGDDHAGGPSDNLAMSLSGFDTLGGMAMGRAGSSHTGGLLSMNTPGSVNFNKIATPGSGSTMRIGGGPGGGGGNGAGSDDESGGPSHDPYADREWVVFEVAGHVYVPPPDAFSATTMPWEEEGGGDRSGVGNTGGGGGGGSATGRTSNDMGERRKSSEANRRELADDVGLATLPRTEWSPEAAESVRCVFCSCRVYPSKNVSMFDSFLELKVENERLRSLLEEAEAAGLSRDGFAGGDGAEWNEEDGAFGPNGAGGGFHTGSLGNPHDPNDLGLEGHFGHDILASLDDDFDDASGMGSGGMSGSSMGGRPQRPRMISTMLSRGPSTAGHGGIGSPTSPLSAALNTGAIMDEDEDGSGLLDGGGDDQKRKPKKMRTEEEDHVCTDCGRVDSPEWRKGPLGPKTLCNACGLRWAKKIKRKGGDPNATASAMAQATANAGRLVPTSPTFNSQSNS